MTENIDTIADLLKLQRAMSDRLASQISSLRAPPSYEAVVQSTAAKIDAAKQALADAIRERDAVVKYWDDRIALLRARAVGQQASLKQIKEQYRKAAVEGKATKAKARAGTAAKSAAARRRKRPA